MSKKNTKRALLSSVLCLVLCLAMLTGTTFAWFTDSVTSGVNKIVAGNLDVELYHTNSYITDEKVDGLTDLFTVEEGKTVLWEPGVMVWEKFTVKNMGNLALKYMLSINFTNEVKVGGHGLSEVLKVAVMNVQPTRENIPSAQLMDMADFLLSENNALAAGAEESFYVAIYWKPTDHDNDYNMNNGRTEVLSIDLGVKLMATQQTAENDSFGNDYDTDAEYPFVPAVVKKEFTSTPGVAPVASPDGHYTPSLDDLTYDDGTPVPADTQLATKIELVQGSNDENSFVYEISVVDKNGNSVKAIGDAFVVPVEIGAGLSNVTVFHKDVAMTAATNKNALSDGCYYYDYVSGVLYICTSSFSPFEIVVDQKGDVLVTNAESFMAALEDGKPVILGADIVTENGFVMPEGKNVVIDLNGYTMTATGERAYLITVSGDADLTIIGGKLISESTNHVLNGTGTSTGASSCVYFASTGKLTMTDVEVQGSVRGGHRAVDIYYGTAELNNVTMDCNYGTGVNAGTDSTVVLNNCDITVNGMYSAPYNSTCFSVFGGGTMTINGGNYTLINDDVYATGASHGGWVGIVMNSGGDLVINDGVFTNVPAAGFMPQYERAIIEVESKDPSISSLYILGGTFDPQEDQVYGGYGDKYYPNYYCNLVDNGDGTWTGVNEFSYAQFESYLTGNKGTFDGKGMNVVWSSVSEKKDYQNGVVYQYFIGGDWYNNTLDTVDVSNVNFKFVDEDTSDSWTAAELQIYAKDISFANCTLDNVAINPWGADNGAVCNSVAIAGCTFKNLTGRYAIHQSHASSLSVKASTFSVQRGIHINSTALTDVTITDNTFVGIGDSNATICLANDSRGDYSATNFTVSGNNAEGQVFLRWLNPTVSADMVNSILEGNTYGTAYITN